MSNAGFDIFDLPQDILDIVFLELRPKEFLNFCSVSRVFWQTQYRNHTYWRTNTSKTFRIPISPLLHAQGDRWFWLYRKLLTETQAFTWGQGSDGALGLPPVTETPVRAQPSTANTRSGFIPALGNLILGRPNTRPNQESVDSVGALLHFDRTDRAWPSKMYVPANFGIIADLQCGGWSTTLLSSKGALFSVGVISARDGRQIGQSSKKLKQLESDSAVPIKSFSAGREHILGLDEESLVWSWDRLDKKAIKIRLDDGGVENSMKASKVVAGWTVSSALTTQGILYWQVARPIEPIANGRPPTEDSIGNRHGVVQATVVCGTDPQIPRVESSEERYQPNIGEVVTYIVLEGYIVFLSSTSKIFASKIYSLDNRAGQSFEITAYSSPDRILKDIQGSFRNFSIFTADGKVLRGTQDFIDKLYDLRVKEEEGEQPLVPTEEPENTTTEPHLRDSTTPLPNRRIISLHPDSTSIPRPIDIPALQSSGVISIAYGDYHCHALHINGTITSYGQQPRSRGSFGLGKMGEGALFRGIKIHGPRQWGTDSRLQPIAWLRGRALWFSESQRSWLKYLEDSLRFNSEGRPRQHPALEVLLDDDMMQAGFSEWIEREGRAWEDGARRDSADGGEGGDKDKDGDQDGLPSHFAISVAAAGWHSGALVLENKSAVESVERKWRKPGPETGTGSGTGTRPQGKGVGKEVGEYVWEGKPFPRIAFPDGSELPGEGELHEWKGGMPAVDELVNTVEDVGTVYGAA